jgi:riboflavin synthase
VDGIGSIATAYAIATEGRVQVQLAADLLRYCIQKGSIAIDGISLTIAAIHDDLITIAVIPHTAAVTTIGASQAGDPVHIELDLIAKYVEQLVSPYR